MSSIFPQSLSFVLSSDYQAFANNFSEKYLHITKSPGVMRTGANVTVMKRKRLYLLRFIGTGFNGFGFNGLLNL